VAHHRAGRADQAEAGYRALIAAQSDNCDALNLLGVLRLQHGGAEEADSLIGRAVALRPDIADYRNNHGEALRALGRLDDAADSFRTALEIDPEQANAHNNLGMIALQRERLGEACTHFADAIRVNDQPARFHLNLGRALCALGAWSRSIEPLSSACERAPGDAGSHRLHGIALQKAGRGEAAIDAYRKSLAVDAAQSDVLNNLGVALIESGAPDLAVTHYGKALALTPDADDVHQNMAKALQSLGRLDHAAEHFEKALAVAPDRAETLNNFGNLRVEQGRVADGLALYERALASDPDHDDAFVNLLARSNQVCDWARRDAMMPLLADKVAAIAADPARAASLVPLTFTLPYFCDDNALIHDVCRLVGTDFARRAGDPVARSTTMPEDPERKLRIGYLSPDFGDHPISHVTLPIYALHDRAAIEVSCYATLDRSTAGDRYRAEIADAADHFVDLSRLSFRAAAERVAGDQIDILVDLTGYMRHSRPQVLALRPAPLQLYWQGHTGSLGAPFIDYVIGDPLVMPANEERFYSEKIIRLPDTFSSADRHPIADAPQARADYGLPEDGTVFCAFNNPLKIEAGVFSAWMHILAALPGSVLWLSRANDTAAESLRAKARDSGIDPARLIFAARVPDKRAHLARHALADLFLDTFHFNASTTALDALWAGLPTLTRTGNNVYSRLCASYLRALGLPELIAADTDAYVDQAINLGLDPDARAALKKKLAGLRETAPLFDAPRFTRHLDAAYRHIWRRHAAGLAPNSFTQPLRRTG
jgi:predicted O-linked N-acetylglucosamine transferase (SPINDLY family)